MATDDAKPSNGKHDALRAQWHQLLKRCLRDNVSYKSFEASILRLLLKCPIDGPGILDAWAASHDGGFTVRPRQVKFFEILLQLRLFTHADVLARITTTAPNTIFAAGHFLIKSGAAKGEYRQCLEAVMLERLSYHLLQMRGSQGTIRDRTFNYRTQRPLLALVSAVIQATSSMNLIEGPALSLAMELGKYVGVFINDLSLAGMLSDTNGGPSRSLKRAFGKVLPQLIHLLGAGSNDVAQSLALLQQQSGLYESTSSDNPQDDMAESLNAMTFQQNVSDTLLVTTRAALYVFLNAMLAGRPICDDPALFTFLNSRYNDAIDSLVIDLVTASFDVLANAINRTEPSDSINVYRSFLINKLPVLLESYSHMLYPPQSIESCVTTALRSMDPSTDPFGTQAFDLLSSSGMLSEARQEFLYSCALYALIPESSIETILGDVTMQNLPESGKYDRGTLVTQCTTNPDRIGELVNELENFEGQAAEISAALTQIIRDCCAGKDSITLKSVCNTLSRKLSALDVLMLFEEPKSFLQPLCELLDAWPDDEEHSEYHPVYDEFGSIFLLVMIVRQRFNIQLSEIGITSPESFVRAYLQRGLEPLAVSELSAPQKTQLAGWVKGLYDSEGNLSDEPMSTCGPKAFHLLVATLFDQSVKASQAGVIGTASLHGGLGYFLEPFLLPALSTGLGWAARKLWETPSSKDSAPAHLDHLVPLLNTLIRPTSLSPEAKSLHESVLITIAAPLERALAHVQALHPRRTDLEPLRAALAPRTPPLRLAALASTAELETWATGTPGGFVPGLRQTLRTLVVWSAQTQTAAAAAAASTSSTGQATASTPPQFTFRQLVHAQRIIGGPSTLTALLDEAMRLIHGTPAAVAPGTAHSASGAVNAAAAAVAAAATAAGVTGNAAAGAASATTSSHTPTYDQSVVIDVLAALLCAPQAQAPRALLSLRQSLSLAAADAYDLSRRDKPRAELIVRLERKVAVQSLADARAPAQNAQGEQNAPQEAAAPGTGDVDGMMGVDGPTDEGAPQGRPQGEQEMDDVLMSLDGPAAPSGGAVDKDAAALDKSLEDELGIGGEGAEGMVLDDFAWD